MLLEVEERLLPPPLADPLPLSLPPALRPVLLATARVATVCAVTVTAAEAAVVASAGSGLAAGVAVAGVAGVVAGLDAADLLAAEVRVARDRGVAMAVVGCALRRSLKVGKKRKEAFANRRATSDQ